ncbi:hypothetical protein BD324DRAFT_626313 [Kockovaella imperatae]|uniref:Uncharacterized protein n=1 Tax=Kockovaella imperatae TaxID=4999 RepID=A0A1Y1UHJ1_9TREE|nr:hypothetical protein BD324DRAFT_626313 [Kockovaella imperatae]ORX37459.1 hypothetical protein BD324DRAFT_626313 [Kockovaella imperatae]
MAPSFEVSPLKCCCVTPSLSWPSMLVLAFDAMDVSGAYTVNCCVCTVFMGHPHIAHLASLPPTSLSFLVTDPPAQPPSRL